MVVFVKVEDFRESSPTKLGFMPFATALEMGHEDAAVHWDRDVTEVVEVREVYLCRIIRFQTWGLGPVEVMGQGSEFYRYVRTKTGFRWVKVRDARGKTTQEYLDLEKEYLK